MAKVLTDSANYSAIADAIREQLGNSSTYTPAQMAAAIASIEGGGGTADYQLVEWIQSDGTQAIDTGLNPVSNSIMVLDMIPMVNASTDTTWYCGCYLASSKYFGITHQAWHSSGDMYNSGSNQLTISDSSFLDLRSIFVVSSRFMESTRTSGKLLNNSVASSNTVHVFAINHNGVIEQFAKAKLYSIRVDNHIFLPCKRLSDGAYGLIDTYDGSFHGDVMGGNAFTAGSVIGDYQPAASS